MRVRGRPNAALSRTRHLAQGHSAMFAWFRRISKQPRTSVNREQVPQWGVTIHEEDASSMEIEIGRGKTARRAYGFDDIAIVPSRRTRDPRDVDISWTFNFKGRDYSFPLPVLASAMDGVVDPAFAITMGKLGGLAVLNLEGIQTRYEDPAPLLDQIASFDKEEATAQDAGDLQGADQGRADHQARARRSRTAASSPPPRSRRRTASATSRPRSPAGSTSSSSRARSSRPST